MSQDCYNIFINSDIYLNHEFLGLYLHLDVSGSMSRGAMSLVMSLVLAALVSSCSLSTISQLEAGGRGRGSRETRSHSGGEW